MNTVHNDASGGSPVIEITDRRSVDIDRLARTTTWKVTEFDYGRSYILSAEASGTQFSAHFDREQWRAFQAMVTGSES